MSTSFKEIDFNKALKERHRNERSKNKTKKETQKSEHFIFAKPKKGEIQLSLTARLVKIDGSNRIVKAEEVYKNLSEIVKGSTMN